MKRTFGMLGLMAASLLVLAPPVSGQSGDPATPPFNLEATLRPLEGGPADGFGLVRFRQPKDADVVAIVDVWVRDLGHDQTYLVQRAVDTNVNDVCTGTNWGMPTLGQIQTDGSGSGRAHLTRNLAAIPLGTEFDIHFRVFDPGTSTVVLQSGCYQFVVSQ